MCVEITESNCERKIEVCGISCLSVCRVVN